ncbi:MAG: NAD(P)/FAD-dependent oxidoreductase [Pseudomonadota bacterium]
MPTRNIETDYLVVGTGAVGMAFADTLLTETDDRIILVDKYAKPGGHWNVAYPFVTLHQPSSFYGVNSVELSRGRIDQSGLNQGLHELASGSEVSAYFENVMKDRFLPSGRVQYFPMSEYKGEGEFVSLLGGESHSVQVTKKTVDATFLNTSVPATHTPNFRISPNVRFMPLNELVKVSSAPAGFTIVGGGKTGIDACLFLIEQGVDPDNIRWIVPRDAWLLDRRNTQSSPEFFVDSIGAQASQLEAIAQSESVTDLFDRLEACGVLLRIDTSVRPKMFHGATISQLELRALRRIKNVVRMGRVTEINESEIVLDNGTIPTSDEVIHVDCSARAIPNQEIKPIFESGLITPQTVRAYQPVFSAAFAAMVEARFGTDEEKNKICGVVPLPNHDTDWVPMTAAMMQNQYVWSKHPDIGQWLLSNRLDGFAAMVAGVAPDDMEKLLVLKRIQESRIPAFERLGALMTQQQ